jgi:hypothetical protein
MRAELLYFDGCPSWKDGLACLKEALLKEEQAVEVDLVLVEDNQQAERLKFLGSPSFRINGMDLWAEERHQYALGCRVYATPNGLKGVPTVEMLREKIRADARSAGQAASAGTKRSRHHR